MCYERRRIKEKHKFTVDFDGIEEKMCFVVQTVRLNASLPFIFFGEVELSAVLLL